jgi:Zn-dependent protease with chaperone function
LGQVVPNRGPRRRTDGSIDAMTTGPDEASPATIDADGRRVFSGISSRAFEHPADRTALTAMRSVPGFDQLLKAASGLLRERQYRLVFLSSSVRVNNRQFPDLDRLMDQVVATLDVGERPELYVYNDPRPGAITLGVDHPFIAISSGLYEITDQDERLFVLGHEMGHVLSGHALYQSMLQHLLNLLGAFGWVPAGGLGLRAIIAGLREWQRKAELSGDRAGLLTTQDFAPALRVHMKLAGGAHLDQIDTEAFLEQAADYEATGDLRDGVLKLLNTEKESHPFAVVRAAELKSWAEGEEYARILAGEYPRREDDHQASFTDNAREAARAYRKRIEESTDPLVGTVRNVGASLGQAAEGVVDWFNRMTRRPEPPAPPAPPAPPPADSTANGQ